MKYDHHLTTKGWSDYELLDSGEHSKLERFGTYVLQRPETQALWAKAKPELWEKRDASFHFENKKGSWTLEKQTPDPWRLAYKDLSLELRLTAFKHTGIFPEQEPNWQWLAERVRAQKQPKVLNLFGYTGAASIVAALAGGEVTHVDASKQSISWAKENAKLSQVDTIRWIADDALAFVKRDVRRGATYDGIILDPPAFGRGAKGEIWHIEEHLLPLLTAIKELLSPKSGSFFLVNGYAAGYAPLSFVQAVESVFGSVLGESGELRIEERHTGRQIPSGIYVRFVR